MLSKRSQTDKSIYTEKLKTVLCLAESCSGSGEHRDRNRDGENLKLTTWRIVWEQRTCGSREMEIFYISFGTVVAQVYTIVKTSN